MVQFFNFQNPETYHCFQWAIHSGLLDVDGLIARTFDNMSRPYCSEIDLATAHLAKEELERLLLQELEQQKKAWYQRHDFSWHRYSIAACAENNDYVEPDALFVTLVQLATDNIRVDLLAEALLRHAGKWLQE
jgi:hypothetical protein